MTAQARKLRGGTDDEGGADRQDRDQPVSWLELFFDLVFVSAFDRLSQRLAAHPTLPSFGVYVLIFLALWWAWLGNTNFAARYGNSCRAYRWGTLAQMLALAALTVSLRGDLRDVGAFFAGAYAAGRALLIVMLVLHRRQEAAAARRDGKRPEEDGRSDRLLVLGFSVGVLLWLASVPLGGAAQLALWTLALAVDVLTVVLTEARTRRELPHQGHYPERLGLLFIVFLGAIVTELSRSAGEQRLRLPDQLPAVLAFVQIMAVWRLYFDEAHTLPALVARRSGRAGLLYAWAYTHLPLMLGLGVLGVGLGESVAGEGQEADHLARLLVSGALAVVLLSMVLLRAFSLRALNRVEDTPGQRPAGREGRGRQLNLSAVARVTGAAVLLLLVPVPLSSPVYEALCAAVLLLVTYLSWRDPLRERLSEQEDDLSDASEEAGQRDDAGTGTEGQEGAGPDGNSENRQRDTPDVQRP